MFNVNNCCQFEGRMTKDPTVTTVGQGQNAFTKVLFNIAVDRSLTKDQRAAVKNGNPNNIVTADFIPCTAIGGKADTIKNYFSKGKPIKVWCSYQAYSKQDPNDANKKIFGHIFVVEELGFPLTDKGGNSNNGGNNNSAPNPPANNKPQSQNDTVAFNDDDIPF